MSWRAMGQLGLEDLGVSDSPELVAENLAVGLARKIRAEGNTVRLDDLHKIPHIGYTALCSPWLDATFPIWGNEDNFETFEFRSQQQAWSVVNTNTGEKHEGVLLATWDGDTPLPRQITRKQRLEQGKRLVICASPEEIIYTSVRKLWRLTAVIDSRSDEEKPRKVTLFRPV